MTNHQENLGAQRTRRNTMKMGAILAFAALGRYRSRIQLLQIAEATVNSSEKVAGQETLQTAS
jgi:hypothetical protein